MSGHRFWLIMKQILNQNEYNLCTLDTCLLLETNAQFVSNEEPFVMNGGDVLNVGDKFTRLDKNGSAGNPPLHIADGWYQQYNGFIDVLGYSSLQPVGSVSRLLLFSAYNIASGACALEKRASKFTFQSICYIKIRNSLFYYNSCNSSRVISCNSIERYFEKC